MKILIVKTSSLGDIIQAFPVLNYLHHFYPNAVIDWVVDTRFRELLDAHPLIHRVIGIDIKGMKRGIKVFGAAFWEARCALRQTQYDVVFDLQGNIKSGLILSQVKSPAKVGFGKKTVPEWPNLFFTHKRFNPPEGRNIREDYVFLLEKYFDKQCLRDLLEKPVELKTNTEGQSTIVSILNHPVLKGKKRVLVCPGTAWKNKQPTFKALKEMLELMSRFSDTAFAFVWGTSEEKRDVIQLAQELGEAAIVVDKLQLSALQHLMGKVDLVVAMDSLALHLAGTTATPTYGLFGPSLASKYNPLGTQHRFFQGSCPYNRIFSKRCPILRSCPTGACLREVPGSVLLRPLDAEMKDL